MQKSNFVNKAGADGRKESICTICVRTVRAVGDETQAEAEGRHVCNGFDLKQTLSEPR